MSDYPRMMYRKGGDQQIHGFDVETLVVTDAEGEREAQGKGWRGSPSLAHGEIKAAPEVDVSSNAPGEAETRIQELTDQLDAATARADGYEAQLADTQASLKVEIEARLAAEKERDEVRARLAAFDRDGNGQAGGSLPRRGRPPKTE